MPASRLALLVVLALVLAACPGRTRQVGGEPPVPTGGDDGARRRFEETRARFQRDGASAADFAAIAAEFPDDPIAPHARLYEGVAALDAGEHAHAIEVLEDVGDDEAAAPEVRRRARLFLGRALIAVDQPERALAALEAGQAAVDRGKPEERADFAAASAEAHARLGRAAEAIRQYDAWYADAGPAERAYALARIGALAPSLERAAAETALAELRVAAPGGPGVALVGAHLAGLYAAAGDGERAASLREETAEARAALGMVEAGGGGGGRAGRLGALLPLSGKRNRLGDAALRGLALAAGTGEPAGPLAPAPFALAVEDDASGAAGVAGAVDRLAADEVLAVVGPIDGRAIEQVVPRAAALGLPVLSLSPAAELIADGDAPSVFHVVHSAEQRARALARRALADGARDAAILRPESRFGQEVARAFAGEFEAGGGDVIVEHAYKPDATSYTDAVGKLRGGWQALFVADGAAALERIAPALAAANLQARPPGAARVKVGRAFQLYALADRIAPRFLRAAGRYAQGAVLAPGFFPDATDPAAAEFATAYQRAFGAPPSALEAYAFDAAVVVGKGIEAGARDRAGLVAWLARARVRGLTGTIAFDARRRRADDGVLYRVTAMAAEQFELRPL